MDALASCRVLTSTHAFHSRSQNARFSFVTRAMRYFILNGNICLAPWGLGTESEAEGTREREWAREWRWHELVYHFRACNSIHKCILGYIAATCRCQLRAARMPKMHICSNFKVKYRMVRARGTRMLDALAFINWDTVHRHMTNTRIFYKQKMASALHIVIALFVKVAWPTEQLLAHLFALNIER